MKRVIENTFTSHAVRASTTLVLMVLCLILGLTYSYFVSKSIFWAYQSNEILSEKIALSSRLNVLESEYLAVRGNTTLAKAHALGLKEVQARSFVSRQSLGKGLSFSDEL